jgi:transmembrane protein EpsG
MTLTNYWWLLIWLFLGGGFLNKMPKRREHLNGELVERWDVLPAILMVLPYIVWAGFRHNYFGDTALYRKTFLAIAPDLSQILSPFIRGEKDPGFTAVMILMKAVIGNADKLFFLLIAAFQLICIALVLRRYTADYWPCIFLFIVSTDYLSWMHNGMRQFIACAIIFGGFRYLVEKQYIKMILLILLASLFHGSALLMIPVVFIVQGKAWDIKTIFFLAATVVVIAFIDQVSPILQELLENTQYDDMMTNEIWSTDDGTNILRVAVYSVPAVLSLFGLRYIRAADDPVINICVNCSIVTMALYLVASVSSGIYIGRLPIYTTIQGYMALPWLIDQMFEKRSAKLFRYMMYGAYLVFFYYQMHFTWGVI